MNIIVTNEDVITSEFFTESLKVFQKTIERSVAISAKNVGLIHTGRQRRSLYVFTKLISHCISMQSIMDDFLKSELGSAHFDHFSIMALSRSCLDACLMTKYIASEAIDLPKWQLRRHVLFLHDLSNRRRFLSAMKRVHDEADIGFEESYPVVKANLIEKIRVFGTELALPQEKIEDLLRGQTVYVDGTRGAVREAGWNVDDFDMHQSYMSAYVHSHPVSYMRADDHAINFTHPSDFQIGVCAYSLSTVARYVDDVNKRMSVFSNVKRGDPIGHVT